jgi:cytochrome c-type biogenesis protein CcmH/NrfG
LAPSSVEPQAMLAGIYLGSGDYDRAAQADSRWRQLSADNPVAADLVAAQIYLQRPRRDPQAAIAALAPSLSAPLSQQQKDTVLSLYCRALVGAGRADEAARLLQPLLSGSRSWRLLWLELAGAGQKDANAAIAWINQVAPLMSDAIEEQVALARAWYEVGTRFDLASAVEKSRDLCKPLIDSANAGAPAWMCFALATQYLGDYAAAEHAFRQVLAGAPHSPDARNDLAYVLWLRGRNEDLPEAQRLAESAVAAAPNVASFYDTLARIQSRASQTDAAIKSFHTALQKDPASLEAMIGLADLLCKDSSRRPEAKGLVAEINRRLKASPPLSSPLRKQFDEVRSAVAESI